MDLDDIPDEAIKFLKDADRAHTEELFNVAVQVAALCQQKMGLQSLFLSIQANGDVVVSVLAGTGAGKVAYARVHRTSKKIEFLESLPEPKQNKSV